MSDEKRPAWFARREISPFTLDDEAVNALISKATHAVVSWVTKDNKPVSAVMLYVVIDGVITVTSTTNRAKYHSWRRNPAASFCIWDPDSIGRQITIRGEIEIMQDAELLHQFTDGFLTRVMGGTPPTSERLAEEIEKFNAPDRHMMQLKVDKILSHDLHRLMQVEADGTDAWS
jgi:pyridoxine/pyridoxamine 5'-phosphate oxidase